ncbi:MAG: CGNR zinc finger domain-containing protein [Thermoanaerobaculia bacterium]|nr:CGNR zinc finger domain-containing protein [Thermoanaerobaculia bacterium]
MTQSMGASWGIQPLLERVGGTIPIVGYLQTIMGVDSINIGWALPDCNAHAPDEHLHLFPRHRSAGSFLLVHSMTPRPSASRYPAWTSAVDPAPGDLRIVQAFVNTLDVQDDEELWPTPEDLTSWLVAWDLVDREAQLTDTDREDAIRFREGLRQLLLTNAGHDVDAGAAGDLEVVLETLPLRCSLSQDGDYRLVGDREGWPGAAARILTLVTRAMSDGTWARLKACRRDTCLWVYYDTSKNRSGKWCSMSGCGNVMKARAYRERRQIRDAAAGSR